MTNIFPRISHLVCVPHLDPLRIQDRRDYSLTGCDVTPYNLVGFSPTFRSDPPRTETKLEFLRNVGVCLTIMSLIYSQSTTNKMHGFTIYLFLLVALHVSDVLVINQLNARNLVL